MKLVRVVHLAALACALAACAEPQPELMLAARDQPAFEQLVYPILLRDCGFHACHGSHERFLQVFGPGRGRLAPETRPLDPATASEIAQSYQRALSMIDAQNPDQSLLLRKPLSAAVHGASHEGVDALGRNVYEHENDAGFTTLRAWVRGELTATPLPMTALTGSTP